MRLRKLEAAADPDSAAAVLSIQCVKCSGFSQWNDAVASGWRRYLTDYSYSDYVCGVCLHDIYVNDNLQKGQKR